MLWEWNWTLIKTEKNRRGLKTSLARVQTLIMILQLLAQELQSDVLHVVRLT